jgi:hypothetical protein
LTPQTVNEEREASLPVNPLTDLLSAKRANAIKAKRKYDPVLVTNSDIESIELGRD